MTSAASGCSEDRVREQRGLNEVWALSDHELNPTATLGGRTVRDLEETETQENGWLAHEQWTHIWPQPPGYRDHFEPLHYLASCSEWKCSVNTGPIAKCFCSVSDDCQCLLGPLSSTGLTLGFLRRMPEDAASQSLPSIHHPLPPPAPCSLSASPSVMDSLSSCDWQLVEAARYSVQTCPGSSGRQGVSLGGAPICRQFWSSVWHMEFLRCEAWKQQRVAGGSYSL